MGSAIMRSMLGNFMKELKITQSELAKWTGLNQGRISLLCTGKDKPTLTEREKLYKLFNLAPEILLDKE